VDGTVGNYLVSWGGMSTSKPHVLVLTGSDAKFWPITKGCVDSLAHLDFSDFILSLGFLNDGLSSDQLNYLTEKNFVISDTKWVEGIPIRHQAQFQGANIKVSKPEIPRIFPGFDYYFWIDADAWVQDQGAVEELVKISQGKSIAIASQRARGYSHRQFLNQWAFNVARDYFGLIAGIRLLLRPYYNSGVFALAADSPVWGLWSKELKGALSEPTLRFFSDQAPLNQVLRRRNLKVGEVSALYNWACHLATPVYDFASARWCSASTRDQIKILHMTSKTKNLAWQEVFQGVTHRMSLWFRGVSVDTSHEPFDPKI
jgi:hypothetical protein